MGGLSKKAFERLFEIAESQQGFFTAKQAREAGFSDNNHLYHVRTGKWVRECRGIYRIAHYPVSSDSQMMILYLWSCNRDGVSQGVFSHQTALSLHELSDINPAKIHLTVPTVFRRFGPIPKVLILHKTNLSKPEAMEMRGFRVTRPMRTILDLAKEESVSRDIIRQAFNEGQQRGLFTPSEFIHAGDQIKKTSWFSKLLKEIQ